MGTVEEGRGSGAATSLAWDPREIRATRGGIGRKRGHCLTRAGWRRPTKLNVTRIVAGGEITRAFTPAARQYTAYESGVNYGGFRAGVS